MKFQHLMVLPQFSPSALLVPEHANAFSLQSNRDTCTKHVFPSAKSILSNPYMESYLFLIDMVSGSFPDNDNCFVCY